MYPWRFWRAVSCLIAGAIGAGTGLIGATQDYEIRSWSLSEGLPHEWVQCFAQTDDGYLWVGTRGGLVRFNGTTLKAFTRANTPTAFRFNDNCLSMAKDKLDG